jgi:predicted DNA-binding transcriptional regulator AlpA
MSTAALPRDASARLLLTIRQVAEATNFSEKTIWTNTSPRGRLACVRVGRSVRYSITAVERWVAEQTVGEESADADHKPSDDPSASLAE